MKESPGKSIQTNVTIYKSDIPKQSCTKYQANKNIWGIGFRHTALLYIDRRPYFYSKFCFSKQLSHGKITIFVLHTSSLVTYGFPKHRKCIQFVENFPKHQLTLAPHYYYWNRKNNRLFIPRVIRSRNPSKILSIKRKTVFAQHKYTYLGAMQENGLLERIVQL